MSNIKDLCRDVSFNRISNWMNITQKKLTNAKLNLGINNEEIILFYDSSLWENGKVGLAICESGIYWKDSFCSPRYINWNVLKKIKLQYDQSNIYFGEKGSFFASETDVKPLVDVLSNLRMNLKIDGFVEKTSGFLGFVNELVDAFFEGVADGLANATANATVNENASTENNCNETKLLNCEKTEIIDVNYNIENNKFNREDINEEIEKAKDVLTYLSKDLIGDIINSKLNNDEDLAKYIVEVTMSSIMLSGDEELLTLLDEELKQDTIKAKEMLDPQIESVEKLLNSDIVNEIGVEKISLKQSINIYNNSIKATFKEYEEEFEENIEDIVDSMQIYTREFRKALNKMMKYCNLLTEKFI